MPAGPNRTVILNLIIIMRMAVCGWRMLPEPHILVPEINTILMTTAIFRNTLIQKLIPPPGILQKNHIPALPPIPVKTPPHRILIPLNRKNVASFICGLVSLPMILSENPSSTNAFAVIAMIGIHALSLSGRFLIACVAL